jgi:FSR family fosmidomycin resistance protein-like MFS transporter
MNERNHADVKVLFALTLIHFIGDFYYSFVNPLLPAFVEKYGLSLTQVGLIVGMMRMLAFIVQPGVGYFADRYRSRIFVLGGPFLAIVFMSLVGWAFSFWDLLVFIAVGSIGTAMFHPSVAGMVAGYAGRHFGFSISIFNMGGTLAFGVGPLFIAYIVGRWGLEASPWSALPGLAVMLLLFRIVPAPMGEGLRGEGFVHAIREAFGEVWRAVLLIWVVMVLRAFVSQAFLAFIPVLYAREGYSLFSIGLIISLFTVAGAVSGLIAGHLSDRIGYRPIFYVSFILSAPSLLMMLLMHGFWSYAGAALAGFFLYAPQPLGLVMAQKLAPRGKSMVSSLMMGLAMGLGGMMAPLVGGLADFFSIRTVLSCLILVPLASIGLVWFFPEKRLREQPLAG